MNSSPLQIDNYTFIDVSVTSLIDNGLPEEAILLSREDIDYEVNTYSFEKTEDNRVALVRLMVKSAEDLNHYKFRIEMMCRVCFASGALDARPELLEDDDECEKILVINSANVMVGLVRERLHSTSSSMLCGPVMLPLVTMRNLNKRDPDSEADEGE